MKTLKYVALAAVVMMGIAQIASAELSGDAYCDVQVNVAANVGVTPDTPQVDAGDVQVGEFTATCVFDVQANNQSLNLQAEASDLYKADDPTGSEVEPIPLLISEPVLVSLQNGNASGFEDNDLDFTADPGEVAGFATVLTEVKPFHSSQNGHFSQLVTLVVTWNQDDPEKTMGEYSGVVGLTAMIIP